MNGFIATATKSAITIERNGKKIKIPVSQLTHDRIAKALEELGIDELFPQTKKNARFAVDNEVSPRPTLVSVERNQPRYGQIKLKTMNPQKTAIVIDPILSKSWDAAFKKLGITADDYYAHLKFLREHGLPPPSNTNRISESELSIPNLNQFGYPIEKSKTVDSTLFTDEEMSIGGSLYEFDLDKPIFTTDSEIRQSIQQLFEFDAEKKKQ